MVTEYVVLLGEDGSPIGQAPKAEVHHGSTPLHLAFSCYAFGPDGRLLMTRRALTKLTFPGVWTNTCCGHPMPGEPVEEAVRRRLRDELGVEATGLVCALPDFRYHAEMNGIEENEICPAYLCRIAGQPRPKPDEVVEARWMPWHDYVADAMGLGTELSPWTVAQVEELQHGGLVERYLWPA